MRLLIVRHAEPDYVHDSLTEKGKREAALLGERLARIEAAAYYVSPLGRAQETASYTLRLNGRQAETLPWLAEFRGYTVNEETGKKRIPWDYHEKEWHDHALLLDRDRWLEDSLVRGGNVEQIWEETKNGVDALLRKHGYTRSGGVYRCERNTDETIVLFCHYAIGMAIVAYLINVPPVPLWQGFLCLPSAVTTVVTQEREKGEAEFRCVALGDVSHLLAGNEAPSLAGLFPECYNGVDSTDPPSWPFQSSIPLVR
ncbi:MAG: histidine phosphatase family protein [Clostridia bacterium]|nr:histidine phosphatase family protein [Clostridia bacterium]MBR0407052.1 histidine phosphatase family protein [Clostridia bacterium]